MKDKPKQI